jgi:hypothetical protein
MAKNRFTAMAAIALIAGTPVYSYAEAGEGLLQRLYRLVHHDAAFQGRLTEVVQRATLKSTNKGLLPRVLFINGRSGEVIEWVKGKGSVEPLICPDGRTLVVRRGSTIERAYVNMVNGQVEAPVEATKLPGVEARQIFGCTLAEGDEGSWDVWLENQKGELQTLRFNRESTLLAGVPAAFRFDPPEDVGRALRKLQGIRADGLVAMVRNSSLVIEDNPGKATQTVQVPVPVTGDAAWLGQSDWLVVTGLKN